MRETWFPSRERAEGERRSRGSFPVDVDGCSGYGVPLERTRPFEPTLDESVALGGSALDARGDVSGIAGVNEDRCSVSDLFHRGAAGGNHGHAACHCFQDGNAEALVERRVGETGRSAVEARKLRIVDLPEPADTVAVDFDAAPAARSDDTQLAIAAPHSLYEPVQVLARFECSDGKDVVSALGRAVAGELVADSVGNDSDLLVRHSEQLHELTPRELRDRDHPSRGAKDGRD